MKLQHSMFVLIVCSFSTAAAQGLRVDQSWLLQPPNGGASLLFYAPFGQEFTPAFDALNAVEFLTADAFQPDGGSVRLAVNLRKDTITGPVIARTESSLLPAWFSGTTKFEFPSLVPVVPGEKYVFELELLDPTPINNWAVAIRSPFPSDIDLPSGLILSGKRKDTMTAYFREGIILDRDLWLQETIIPEPSPLEIGVCALAVWFLIRPHQRSRLGDIRGRREEHRIGFR